MRYTRLIISIRPLMFGLFCAVATSLPVRAALIRAAMDPEGLTLLNVLRKLPTNMQLQGEILLGLAKEIDKAVKATNAYTEEMAKLSATEAAAELTTPNKYLMLAQGQAHIDFSELDAGITDVMNSVPDFTLPEPSLLKSYLYPTVLSFFEVYIANNPQYRPYLSSAYNAYLSQDQNFKVYMISAASEPGLAQAI